MYCSALATSATLLQGFTQKNKNLCLSAGTRSMRDGRIFLSSSASLPGDFATIKLSGRLSALEFGYTSE